MSELPDPLIGALLDQRYQITKRLAEGGMGAVYLAQRTDTGELSAIKVLRPEVKAQESTVKRFIREAQLLSVLRHPNTVSVYHFGEDASTGAVYLAMEYLDGASLFNYIRDNGKMALAPSVSILLQVLASLEDAHEKGIIHRDLKPGNVMIIEKPGEPMLAKVLDFGLAKVYDPDLLTIEKRMTALTRAGEVVGTLHYMAPEQLRGESLTAAADIYSAAVLLFFMLAGRRPFEGKKNAQVLACQLTQPFPRLALPLALQEVLDKAAAKDPTKRYQTAAEFEHAILLAIPQEERTIVSLKNPTIQKPPRESQTRIKVESKPEETPSMDIDTLTETPSGGLRPKRFPTKKS